MDCSELEDRAKSVFSAQGFSLESMENGFLAVEPGLEIGVAHSDDFNVEQVRELCEKMDRVFVDEGCEVDKPECYVMEEDSGDVDMPSFEMVGSIAIVSELDMPEEQAVKRIREQHSISEILLKTSPVKGELRVADYKTLYKQNNDSGPVTSHVEHGCSFRVNPREMYFSERLSSERMSLIEDIGLENRAVLVVGAGVGCYPIVMQEHSNASEIVGIEKNPEAAGLFQSNIESNGCGSSVSCVNMDFNSYCSERDFDVLVVCTPEFPSRFLDHAVELWSGEGVLVFYCFTENREEFEQGLRRHGLETRDVEKAGEVGPDRYRLRITAG